MRLRRQPPPLFPYTTLFRSGYFGVLMAERSLRVSRAFSALTTEVYSIQVTRLRLGQAAPYEPMQARVLALQARDRKSTRLNSSQTVISYDVFFLEKKKATRY